MKLKVRIPNLDAGGKTVVIINDDDAKELGVYPLDRIVLKNGKKCLTVIINTTNRFVRPGEIVVYEEVRSMLSLKKGMYVTACPREELISKHYIKMKVAGKELSYRQYKTIAKDVMARNLNDLELASFITALAINGMTLNENVYMARAMIDISEKIKFSGKVSDKHSIGGIPGDKTSIVVVPIVAASGLKIPKTSSRAITDPAGTADRMEILAPVDIGPAKMRGIVEKTGGCLLWGGSVELAPVDDLFIQIERPLSMDPLLIPSVMSKKKVVGAKTVVIDIPVGPYAKVKSEKKFREMSRHFTDIGRKLGMKVRCVKTNAKQPIGYAMGPALEAREALQSIMDIEKAPEDLVDKVSTIAGEILKLNNKGNKKTAVEIWKSGKAEKKLREIIKEQGGNQKITPDKIHIGRYNFSVKAKRSGRIKEIHNRALVCIAKAAGAPKDRGSGVLLHKKLGNKIKRGEVLFRIYADKKHKLGMAVKIARESEIFSIGR